MDKEDIIKFRRTCETMLNSKQKKLKEIADEVGLSEPSVVKILNTPLPELKGIRASTLGAIQDFNKNHRDDCYRQEVEEPAKSNPIPKSKETRKEIGEESAKQSTFWSLINEASRCTPANVELVIKVKPHTL